MRLALLALLVPSLAHAGPTWQPDWSKAELSSTDAEAYCTKRGKAWRLPTKDELKAVTGKLPDDGYLWSGEDVNADRVGQRWIMNLANKHIFNGDGRTGFAKCVKGTVPAKVEKPLGPPYATIGKADAKLTVLVAVQPDYPWWKIRPTLDELAAKHDVKFDLRLYLVWDKYEHAGIAYCAAAHAGKLADFEAKLQAAGVKAALDARAMRALAIAAGVDGKTYDKHAPACRKLISADHAAFEQRSVEGVPAFWVGTTKIVGAKPDELRAAIEAALKG